MNIIEEQLKNVSFYLNGEFWKTVKMLPEKVEESKNFQVLVTSKTDSSVLVSTVLINFSFDRYASNNQSYWQYHASVPALKVYNGEIVWAY